MGSYAVGGTTQWHNSKICPTKCVALAEIVNLPRSFVSSNPYYVIQHTHWIMWYVPPLNDTVPSLTSLPLVAICWYGASMRNPQIHLAPQWPARVVPLAVAVATSLQQRHSYDSIHPSPSRSAIILLAFPSHFSRRRS